MEPLAARLRGLREVVLAIVTLRILQNAVTNFAWLSFHFDSSALSMLGGSNTRWLLFNGGSNDFDTPQNAVVLPP